MNRSHVKPAGPAAKPNRPQANQAGPPTRPNRQSGKPRGLRYQPVGVVAQAGPATVLNRLLYKPIGMIAGFAAGALAGLVLRQLWRLMAGKRETPDPLDEDRGWGEVLGAAAVQGAMSTAARAAVERGVAHGVRQVTGRWPK